MSREKVAQNKLILELRDQKKMNWQQILDELHRRGHSGLSGPASVKTKYCAMKRRQKVSVREPEKKIAENKERKKEIKTESQEYGNLTIKIPVNLIIKIKMKAARERKTMAALVEETLTRDLSK